MDVGSSEGALSFDGLGEGCPQTFWRQLQPVAFQAVGEMGRSGGAARSGFILIKNSGWRCSGGKDRMPTDDDNARQSGFS